MQILSSHHRLIYLFSYLYLPQMANTTNNNLPAIANYFMLVAPLGFAPRPRGLEPPVLLLHYRAIKQQDYAALTVSRLLHLSLIQTSSVCNGPGGGTRTLTVSLPADFPATSLSHCSLDYAFNRSGWEIIVSARPSFEVSLNVSS